MKRSPIFAVGASLILLTVVACSSGTTTGTGLGGNEGSDSGASADGSATTVADAGPTKSGDGGEGGSARATGLQGFCEYYFECGGTYYKDVEACIKASVDYWKECRRPELDAFGDCMMGVSCKDWNPDTYNPASTKCSSQWSAVTNKKC